MNLMLQTRPAEFLFIYVCCGVYIIVLKKKKKTYSANNVRFLFPVDFRVTFIFPAQIERQFSFCVTFPFYFLFAIVSSLALLLFVFLSIAEMKKRERESCGERDGRMSSNNCL
jgi:hypothetical protein